MPRMHRLSTRRSNGRIPAQPTKRWFDGKDHNHYMLKYRLDETKRHNLCSDQVDEVCSSFQTERNQQERADKESKWRMAIYFHDSIAGSDNGGDGSVVTILGKLCDHFFRLEQNGRYISRANFVQCVQQTSTMSIGDINTMYAAFDPMKRDEVDWRVLAFMIYAAARPSQSCKDVLRNAFKFYIGNVGRILYSPGSRVVRLRDMKLVLDPLVQSDGSSDVLERFDAAWGHVVASEEGCIAVESVATVSFDVFERMLDYSVVEALLEEPIQMGNNALSFQFCVFEHEYYPTTLLKHVTKARRASAITVYLHNLDTAQKKASMSEWRLFVSRRRHAKDLVSAMSAHLSYRQSSRGFRALRRWALCQVAAVEIQRVARGFFGRVNAKVSYIYMSCSVCLQSCARRFIQRCRYLYMCASRASAAIKLQRVARGNRGRKISINALLAKVEMERRDLEKTKRRWEQARQKGAATAIQKVYRSTKSREETWKRLGREAGAKKRLEEERSWFRRERRVFETELEEFYRYKKAEKEAADASKTRADQERIRIRNLQRRIVRQDLNAAADMKMAIHAKNDQLEATQYVDDWNAVSKARGEEHQRYCSQCLQDPRTTEERRTRAALQKKIKKRTSDVLKRADAREIEMEIAEAKDIATQEILELEAAEEGERVKEEWRKDSMQRAERRKRSAEERKRLALERRDLNGRRAALVLTTAYRRWSARKTLRRLCSDTFEKHFDERHHAFYYKNRRTGEIRWEKPMALGCIDLPTADEWKVLRDAQDFPYYYNPCTLEMSWQPPSGQVTCEAKVRQPWIKEYPVPLGPCEYFAISGRANAADGRRLCKRCAAT